MVKRIQSIRTAAGNEFANPLLHSHAKRDKGHFGTLTRNILLDKDCAGVGDFGGWNSKEIFLEGELS